MPRAPPSLTRPAHENVPDGERLSMANAGKNHSQERLFEHYLYVLQCSDESLYTGYTTDVDARFEAHCAGKGAKFTKSHRPVKILARARFYSKSRAMSAEYLFKKLPRARKDALVAACENAPFEDVLRRELPGFGEDTAAEFVCRKLAENIDDSYRDFNSKLIPTIDPKTMAGVRTPVLRAIAKQLAKRPDADAFLKTLPHGLFEENQVHAFAIGLENDYDRALARYEAFLPYVDNWATCDQLPVRILAARPDETLAAAQRWIASGRCYTIRFGIGVLMKLFLDDLFERGHLGTVAAFRMPGADGARAARGESETAEGIGRAPDDALDASAAAASRADIYYVDMMRAWYFAEALVKQPQAALPYFERREEDALLDEWTRRKAIQKAVESRRIPEKTKDYLRTLR